MPTGLTFPKQQFQELFSQLSTSCMVEWKGLIHWPDRELSPLEVEQTRKIAHSRIHVECVTGQVRNKYTILQDTIPIDYLHGDEDDIPVNQCD